MVCTKVIFVLKVLNNFWINLLTNKTVKAPKTSIVFDHISFEDHRITAKYSGPSF